MRFLLFLILSGTVQLLLAQEESVAKKLQFNGDFRFRIEQDWNSRKSDGTFRDDRSRLRYRFRLGATYEFDAFSTVGCRIRTGNIDDQQGPHLTLGGGNGEFGLARMGFERLFYQYKGKHLQGWIGKNTMPLKKNDELFWNDNVFPEGIAMQYNWELDSTSIISAAKLIGGHFIIKSNGKGFEEDSYMQVLQLHTQFWDSRLHLFPGLYYFHSIGNIPDGMQTFMMSYTLLHLGGSWQVTKSPELVLGLDYYANLQDYNDAEEVHDDFRDQKQGWVASVKWQKKAFFAHLYYAHLQQYSIVDYFAQNDWARWDYSSLGARGSRLSNFQGVELRLGYQFKDHYKLVLRSYIVEQLTKLGLAKETGSRIRLDLDIKF